jgi:hypothetical protein
VLNKNQSDMNIRKRISKKILQLSFILFFTCLQFLQAQTSVVNWQGKISIGGKTTSIHCNINLKATGELYLQADSLQVFGNFTGETGSKVFFPADAGRYSFMNVLGWATGTTEIIPDFPDDWDGSRIDFIKAQRENSVFNAFQMQDIETDNFLVQLKNETHDNALIWYVEKTEINPCLPLIVQLGNHTLLVNNNAATNGGYKFVYYRWYKNGVLLKEDSHTDNGGSYYTGGADLDINADYTVEATDGAGNRYLSCSYRFVPLTSPMNISVYPNPALRSTKAYIQVETQDLTLLDNAVVEIYDLTGQYTGKTQIKGKTLTSLDLPNKSGLYVLKFKAKDFIQTIKLIVE